MEPINVQIRNRNDTARNISYAVECIRGTSIKEMYAYDVCQDKDGNYIIFERGAPLPETTNSRKCAKNIAYHLATNQAKEMLESLHKSKIKDLTEKTN